MPTYEYECQECGYLFEKFQSMTAKPLRKCPKCNGKVQRLISTGAAVIFKGSGFYETDYKRASVSSQGASDTSEAAKTESTSETKAKKSDSKSTSTKKE